MIEFTKAVASGNDFIIFDVRSGSGGETGIDYSDAARDLCRRNIAVGADGILVLEPSNRSDFRMRIINPDGSEVDMCGNGARCSALYASKKGWGDDLSFETGAGLLSARVRDDLVSIGMSDPINIQMDVNLEVGSDRISVNTLNTGVPHVVHFVEDIDAYSVKDVGRRIREHTNFAPEGTNVNFVGKIENGVVKVRTYERGVEDETLACGTGSVAAAVVSGLLGFVRSPVRVKTKSGEVLTVSYELSGKEVTNVCLEGNAKIVYEGKVM